MKHPALVGDAAPGEIELLRRNAGEYGLELSTDQAVLLLRHLDLVLSANERLNLTRITQRESAISGHIVDSLAAVPLLRALTAKDEVADLGSGAGYPGIPLAILLPTPITLVESIGKKASFLQGAAERLEVETRITVFGGRAEDLAIDSPGRFAAVSARAVASMASLVELAAPLLRDDGVLIALKGSPEKDELKSGEAAARLVGMEEVGRVEYALPEVGHKRMILTYARTGVPSRALPRRPGMAQRHPLA